MRRVMLALLALMLVAATGYPVVRSGAVLRFPADHGAHPAYRTEWWYVTGKIKAKDGRDLGFQITFFRTTPKAGNTNPSRFAPRQILFAHAALSDPKVGHLLHAERAARSGFGLAQARVGDTDIALRDWRIRRLPGGRFATTVATRDFSLSLILRPTQPPLPQG